MSLVVLFPVGKERAAAAYRELCNAHSPDKAEGAVWYPEGVVDKYGQTVVGYLGPGGLEWEGEPFPEPKECEEARMDGVLAKGIERDEEE
jgi:hypothetical protein